MVKFTWVIAAGLMASATGCDETMDTSYSPGYGDGYNSGYSNSGYNGGYYSQPAYYRPAPVNNYYYSPAPTVVHDTRYVPVPVPAPAARPAERNDRRDGNRDANVQHRNDRTPPVATQTTPAANNNGQQQQTNRKRGTPQDRDGNGKPDAPHTDRRS